MRNQKYQTIDIVIEALNDLKKSQVPLTDRQDLIEAGAKILLENDVYEPIDDLGLLIEKLEEIRNQKKKAEEKEQKKTEKEKMEEAKALTKAERDELMADYERHLKESGDEKKALEATIKENKSLGSSKEIENIIRGQEKIRSDNLKKGAMESKVKQQIIQTTEKLVTEENIVKRKEIIKDLGMKAEKYIKGEFVEAKSSLEKTLLIEVKNFISQNSKEITELRRKYLKEEIERVLDKPEASLKQTNAVLRYSDFAAKTIYPESEESIGQYKQEAIENAESKGLRPGQVANGWKKLEVLEAIKENPTPVKDLIKEYDEIKSEVEIPVNIPQCDVLDEAFDSIKRIPKLNQLVSLYQSFTGKSGSLWWKAAEKIGLDKVLIKASEKILGSVKSEFAKNALIIFSNRSFQEGSVIVLSNFMSGGQKAVTTAAAIITAQAAVQTTAGSVVAAEAAMLAARNSIKTVGEAAVLKATEQYTAAKVAAEAAKKTLANLVGEAGGKVATASFGTSLLAGLKTALGPVGWLVTAGMILLQPLFNKIREGLQGFFGDTLGGILSFGGEMAASIWGTAKASSLLSKLGGLLGIGKGAAAAGGVATAGGATAAAGGVAAAGGTAAVAAGGWAPLAVVGVILLIFILGISTASMVSSLVPPEGTGDVETTGEYEYSGECVNRDYPETVESKKTDEGVVVYVFEPGAINSGVGQLYDLSCVDKGYLKGVPDQYKSSGGNRQKVDERIIPAYTAMVEAARKDGIGNGQLLLTSGFRSVEDQAVVRGSWEKTIGNVLKKGDCYKGCEVVCNKTDIDLSQKIEECTDKYAARPGTSNHMTGRALDLVVETDEAYNWLKENGARFGFAYNYPLEKWHWEYSPK